MEWSIQRGEERGGRQGKARGMVEQKGMAMGRVVLG